MKIEVTGCNNCPFRGYNKYNDAWCYLDWDIEDTKFVDVVDSRNSFVSTMPPNCPITLNGGEITIKTKTE